MPENRERYQKLPGHRRGILRGASVWLGSDHLLAVKSSRFREDYKRYHLRDIQAIAVARGSRFHISSRAIGIAVAWLVTYFFARNVGPWIHAVFWTAAVCLVGSWAYVSSERSCRCRIYTAVSRDDLPSVYRTWTARRFLEKVEPRIAQVQGQLQGEWAEAVEGRTLGPADAPPPMPAIPTGGELPSQIPFRPIPRPAGARRTLVSDLFVVSLFADAAVTALTLHSASTVVQWVLLGLVFPKIGLAILIFIQHHRRVLATPMQRLALITLVVMGALYYTTSVADAANSSATQATPSLLAFNPLARQIGVWVYGALGLVGTALMFTSDPDQAPPPPIAG